MHRDERDPDLLDLDIRAGRGRQRKHRQQRRVTGTQRRVLPRLLQRHRRLAVRRTARNARARRGRRRHRRRRSRRRRFLRHHDLVLVVRVERTRRDHRAENERRESEKLVHGVLQLFCRMYVSRWNYSVARLIAESRAVLHNIRMCTVLQYNKTRYHKKGILSTLSRQYFG